MLKTIAFLATIVAFHAQAELTLKEYLALPAAPIDAKVSIDEAKKVTVLIKAKTGGSLELTNKKGDKFKLTIPADALLTDTEISLSPISSMETAALNFAQTPAGVEISPDGLDLLKMATLTITPATKIAPNELAAFTTDSVGTDLHLANVTDNGAAGPIELKLIHFSTYSVYGSLSVREHIRAASMSLQRNRISNWVAEQLLRQKNGETFNPDFFTKSAKDWADNVIKPIVNDIRSCAAGIAAIKDILGLERQSALLGLDLTDLLDKNVSEVLYNKTYTYCYKDAERACYEDHRPFDVQLSALGAARQSMLLLDSLNPFAQKMLDLADNCLHFEFELNSKMTGGEEDGGVSITARAKFPFNYNSYGNPVTTSGDLYVTDMSLLTGDSDTVCPLTSLVAPPIKMTINRFTMADIRFDQTLWVDLGNLIPPSMAQFLCTYTNPDTGEQQSYPIAMPPGGPATTSVWGGMLVGTHTMGNPRDYNMNKGQLEPRKWTVLYGDIFATKSYQQKVQEITEKTDFIIYHRPKR